MARALINVPAEAKRGEIIEIKTLISHPMETGYRRTRRRAIRATSSVASSAPMTARRSFAPSSIPAIAANPFIAFSTVATESGDARLQLDRRQRLHSQTETAKITVA